MKNGIDFTFGLTQTIAAVIAIYIAIGLVGNSACNQFAPLSMHCPEIANSCIWSI